ncbi:MAG: lipase [Gammaproteobacteria bacterium]|nr:lipase [Gammaproteobacteria bacterium]MBU2058540.1 lipase [Gammaproteobacteria bacterium]MBU2175565.1 lipase [Gammaproteobacteria bacterium]MBU2248651.1 lipase [Gammaproteobacteria bacterium]MBU2344810.1 lipase [Gammaproteobacteria bacterium]
MNKLLLSFAIASALGLAGCGGESLDEIKEDTQTGGEVQIPLSRVVYDPANGVLSAPNDLLLQGTTDGTLFMPGEKDAAGAHLAAPNYADPSTALGALDGWSTQNPFTIALNFTSGVSLDAASVQQPGSVYLVETLMGDPASPDADCRAVPRGAACKAVGSLTFGVDYVTRASGNSVAVIPLKPLKPATTYILVFTDNLKDSEGRSVAPSSSYELVKQDINTKPLGTAAQLALQGVINSFENAVSAESINKDGIIYTAAITTQSTAPVFGTIKQLMAPSPLNNNTPPSVALADTGVVVSDLLFPGQTVADSLADPRFIFKLAKLYSGTINLPYYLGAATVENPMAPLSTRWMARCDSGAIIASLTDAQKTALEGSITDPAQAGNDAFCNAASNGALRDFGLDKQRHLTKFNVIPKVNSTQTLAVQVTVPDEVRGAALGLVKPAAGWPVVMLQHGITSKKEDMLAITGALSARGFATIAIDHPLHGSRGFGPLNASNGNATIYMNLSNLLVTRDNLRQSIADMLGLRLGMNFNNQPGLLNTQDVQFLGHSLGAISGTAMVALANSTTGSAQLDALYNIRSATLAMPGGAIANFLLESAAFGPTIKASVLLGAGGTTAQGYIDFATNNACGAGQTAPYAACFNDFVQALAVSNPAALATLNASFSSFAFAAQTVTDAGDPNNYASMLVASETPTYIIEVVGDGAEQLPDQVIPNRSAAMPLAGTEPLAALLGASALSNVAGTYPVTGTALSRFIAGNHSSILSPTGSAAATAEMQGQSVSFFMGRGAAVVVTNGAVMAPAN